MAHLALALLGDFQATLDGQPPVGLNSDRLRGLLAYLAVESGREHPRELVAALLWPERPDREALSSLRYALSNLRHALGDRRSPGDCRSPGDRQAQSPFLLITRTHVQFNPASDHWLDLAEFHTLINQPDAPSLKQATALYRGPFLDGLSIADSPAFDEWMLLKGEEIQRSVLALLDRLAVLHLGGGETAEAALWARRQLELDPYREQAHRQLMAALALGGERSAALAHFEVCRRLLAQELSCEPEDETQELYTLIREGALPQLPSIPVVLSSSLRQASTVDRAGSAALRSTAPEPVPFVARQAELAKLGSLLNQALAGRGGVALIAGEAGSGKTALLDEFSRQAGQARPNLIALRGRCSAHAGAGDPFLPFREILQTLTGDIESKRAGGTLSPEQARRIWQALPVVSVTLVEHGPDLIDRFVPGEALLRHLESFSTHTGAARWQRQLRELLARPKDGAAAQQPDLFTQVTKVLQALSVHSPLLLAIDDLQWTDSGTAALLFHLGRHLAGSRVMILCAFRPQALVGDAGSEAAVSGLGLAPGIGAVLQELAREWGDIQIDLDQADGQAFVGAFVDSEPNCLDADFRQKLYNHTDGNPLFTGELLRSFERQGMLVQDEAGRWIETPELDWEFCPPQVEAVIAGHLAGLPDEDRSLLQAAAVQGEQFAAEVVARALARDEENVIQRLSGSLRRQHRLVQAVSLDRLASTGQRLSHYRFRHVLIQRSAYASLDAVERARLHEATGQNLEAIYVAAGEKPQGLAAELARHYEAAGLPLHAARALHDAGQQAMWLSASRQALDRFEHGLALLADLPPSAERNEIERLLEVARLGPQMSLAGSGSAALAGALARAAEAGGGDTQGRPKLLMLTVEASLLTSRGQFEDGLAVAVQMLDLATQWTEEGFVALAHWFIGLIYNLMGKPQVAESHFNWILARRTLEPRAELRSAIGQDLMGLTFTFSSVNQWFLGYPEKALACSTQAVTSALEQGDLHGQALASAVGLITLFLLRSDAAALHERAKLAHRLCLQKGLPMWQVYAEVFLGWLAVMRGEDVAGIEQMQSAIAGWQARDMAIGTDSLVLVLANGCLASARRHAAGDDAPRAVLLATALAEIEPLLGPEAPCGQSYQAELHRLQGELLLERDGLGAVEEALTCFHRSMELGRNMNALAWELRAAMSLVRLRKRQGEAFTAELVEARDCLRNLYARFTEGFSFPDLQEAAALIGEAC